MSFFLYYAYSLTINTPPAIGKSVSVSSSISQSSSTLSEIGNGGHASNVPLNDDAANVSFVQFLCEVFAFFDMNGTLSPVGDYSDNSAVVAARL